MSPKTQMRKALKRIALNNNLSTKGQLMNKLTNWQSTQLVKDHGNKIKSLSESVIQSYLDMPHPKARKAAQIG